MAITEHTTKKASNAKTKKVSKKERQFDLARKRFMDLVSKHKKLNETDLEVASGLVELCRDDPDGDYACVFYSDDAAGAMGLPVSTIDASCKRLLDSGCLEPVTYFFDMTPLLKKANKKAMKKAKK